VKRFARRHIVTALLLVVAFACQETWTLAGTTGGLSGSVIDADSSAPVAGAQVTVNSPSQTTTATTDGSGRFTFLTLAPDTYTITVSKSGYQNATEPGQIVFADTVQVLAIRLSKALKTIARVAATGAGALVKSGTTADVYSVNATGQSAAQALGGGGSLNSAYSAIATVPGAYVIPNQTGYYQTVSIRGGDYDQVGYEFDGVPVNRSFDNYPSTSVSSLGNAEVQVYTGANPANSEGQGLAGYINQVIKTGTYPGYAEVDAGIGTPTYYHQLSAQVGGSTPDRLFSYYVGVGGYNQDIRYIDNQNGAGYDAWQGTPLSPDLTTPCTSGGSNYTHCYAADQGFWGYGPAGYLLGAFNYALPASTSERDVVANVHVGIPHHNDAGKDDVQILWNSSSLLTSTYTTTNDIVNPSCGVQSCFAPGNSNPVSASLGQPVYYDGYLSKCATGGLFDGAASAQGCTGIYYYPSSSNRTAPFQPIPADQRDTIWNDQEIVKLQYTKNFGSTSFLRLYGYTYYSDWLNFGPQCQFSNYGCGASPDYELNSHTRGISLAYQNQINQQNLLSMQASYTTANSIRDNNSQQANFAGIRSRSFVAVDSSNPYDGVCYHYNAATSSAAASATPTSCNPTAGFVQATFGTWAEANSGMLPVVSDATCGKAKCEMLAAENSLWATYNNVVPRFLSASLTDELRPSDRWLFNLGVRLDSFTYIGMDTTTGNDGALAPQVRSMWFKAYNLDTCVNDQTGRPVDKVVGLGIAYDSPCPGGFHKANLQNVSGQNFTFNQWQPRISGTYTVNPDNVIRFSFGRYTQAPNAAFEQYNTLEEDLPFALLGANLYPFGRSSPGYPIYPPTSLNYDLSWEHHFKGTDWSFKVTPFLRQTQDQIQQFFLNQQTAFVSGLNTGSQRSQGVEFQMQKGDFSRNGISGLLSFAYTNSYVKYGTLPNGTTVITPINNAIGTFNSFTKACAPGGSMVGKLSQGVYLCGGTGAANAAPCYSALDGSPAFKCTAADVGNPYWNSPAYGFINAAQAFPTYSTFPGGIGSSAAAFGAPYVATVLVNYRHDKFSITPSFQFEGGARYGYPVSTPGIDPRTCLAGYGYGVGVIPGTGGAFGTPGGRYNATACAGSVAIPNQFTNQFDALGSFIQPSNFVMNLQLSYDVSPRVSLTGVLANVVNTCWGGTTAAWTVTDHNVCSYIAPGAGSIYPTGNFYNPRNVGAFSTTKQQGFVQFPYGVAFGPYNQNTISVKTPFNFYVSAKLKI